MHPANSEAIAIAVFSRAPVTGQAKTRLIPAFGAEKAASLQAAFLRQTLQTAISARLGPVSLWCSPDCAHPAFQQCRVDYALTLHQQCDGDLGKRMLTAFERLCSQYPVLLIGTDCPALTTAHLHRAAAVLQQGDDAVFLPAGDGGYVLIGLRQAEASLFTDMPWGSDKVMAETRRRLLQAGLRWQEPVLLWDVDEPEDLAKMRSSGLMNEWFEENMT
jgi:rSAM/selenodomain-associated transferase 1